MVNSCSVFLYVNNIYKNSIFNNVPVRNAQLKILNVHFGIIFVKNSSFAVSKFFKILRIWR